MKKKQVEEKKNYGALSLFIGLLLFAVVGCSKEKDKPAVFEAGKKILTNLQLFSACLSVLKIMNLILNMPFAALRLKWLSIC